MKIAICVPIYGDPRAQFTFSLANLLINAGKAGLDVEMIWATGSSIAMNRQSLAEQALEIGADFILWLDADHLFPPDTLGRLLLHKGKAKIVGCNYPRRFGEFEPTAQNIVGGTTELVFTTEDLAQRKIVQQVDFMGLGVCLMEAAVFSMIEKPWFAVTETQGEDGYFFRKLAMKGVRPFVDHHLSWEIGHVTARVLTNADAIRKSIRQAPE